MSEVFISYARSTETYAKKVASMLRAEGFDVWYDEDLPAHRPYTNVIDERLRSAKAVVVPWSAEAVKSEWVQSEADRARLAHKLVQLTIDGTMPPMPFDRIHCANMKGWTGNSNAPGWQTVVRSVAELVGTPAVPGSSSLKSTAFTRPLTERARAGAVTLSLLMLAGAVFAVLAWFCNALQEALVFAQLRLASETPRGAFSAERRDFQPNRIRGFESSRAFSSAMNDLSSCRT